MIDDKSLASGPQLQPQHVQVIFRNNHPAHRRKTAKTGDSAEVFIGDESIGVLADDKEDGDDSFTFRMAILDIDLEEDA